VALKPHLKAPFSIPLIRDRKTETIVNNENGDTTRILYTSFNYLLPESWREANAPGGGLYPVTLRPGIDEMNAWIQFDVPSLCS
jgi:glutathionyl-hydroquinone reductase